ncbi:MAG TPA: ATP-binding protein [Candidatus Polarisedimenticolia bacterium]|nr:ATP-binding protein [Candidatus Polarisedimenticolia bacterium]
MDRLKAFLKRNVVWVGFAGALVPLLTLLGLQFALMSRLQRVSAVAHRAALSNYLEAIGTEVQYFYRSAAERALNIPPTLFTQEHLDKVATYWEKKPVEGARRLFLVDFTTDPFGHFLVYNPATHRLETPPASDEALAIIVACNPWQVLSYRGGTTRTTTLMVDERNPEYRIILNPITDESAHILGLAGMILDEEYFRTDLLPAAISKALPSFFPYAPLDDLEMQVEDSKGRILLGEHTGDDPGEEVKASIPFVFTDWTLNLHSPRSGPEAWARANFAFNLSLSALIAVVLLGGLVLSMRAASREVRLSRMKSDFVSNVSHELRTPLASVRVFAELLRLGRVQSPDKVREYGEYIEAESRRLSRLIENILDFSRIESGRKTYTFALNDVREVVAATVRTFEVHLRSQGFHILFEAPEVLPEAEIDADAIGQALHNLLDNAVKYSGASREILVRMEQRDSTLVIAVQDHGIGIPRSEQGKIFDRFHRVSTGLVHDVKGSGLGLSIVHHIARIHHGRILVDSEPGRGSTFSIHLPLPG